MANSGRNRAFLSRANPPRIDSSVDDSPRRNGLRVVELERKSELTRKPHQGDHPAPSLRQRAPKARRSETSRASLEEQLRRFDSDMSGLWKQEAYDFAEGLDEVTGKPLVGNWDAHHVIEQSTLFSMFNRLGLTIERLAELLWDPRNRMALNEATHDGHTSTMKRIPRRALREHHWDFAGELDDLLPGTQWATALLERSYPEATR